ncbi:MAG: hypothetical protein IJG68_07865 [Bacilli bacterium]|nr:hypothetical protein [Bacilli bacterium]
MKKYLLLFLVVMLFVLTITGCASKKTITLEDKELGLKTTFTYNDKEKFSEVTENEEGKSKEILFKNEDLDLEFEMYYTHMSKSSYDKSKQNRSLQKYYKEYKFGKYDAYVYGNYDSSVYLSILLNEEKDEVDSLFVSVDRIDNNQEIKAFNVVADKTMQNFFGSIEFKKIK